MTKPTKFKVGYFTWKIIWSKERVEEAFGKTDVGSKVITIYKHEDKDLERETLFHELLHAALDDKCEAIFYFSDDQKLDAKEENLVRLLSPVLMNLLFSNPKLHNYLSGGNDERRSKINKEG